MRKKIIKNDTIFNHSVNSPLQYQNIRLLKFLTFSEHAINSLAY